MYMGVTENQNARGPSLVAILGILTVVLPAMAPGAEPVRDANEPVEIKRVFSGQSVRVFVANRAAYDVTVELTLHTRNGRVVLLRPQTETYGPHSETEVARIEAVQRGGRYTWRYRFKWTRGSLHAVHDPDTVYRLPFRRGTSHRVSQSYGGRLSHRDHNYYAVDFAMREGTPICAARSGVVVDLKEWSKVGGPSKRYRENGNFVSIAHADGTIGEYYHLRHNGVQVEIGQRVTAGQVIAFSGDTGYSTHPHLHFGVYSAAGAEDVQSHPITFATARGLIGKPVEGRRYTAK